MLFNAIIQAMIPKIITLIRVIFTLWKSSKSGRILKIRLCAPKPAAASKVLSTVDSIAENKAPTNTMYGSVGK